MKIIAGTAKGRSLKAPKNSKIIRPALSQVREAIFSSLGDLTDKVILDVFAGTGSLGLEGLSRGADFAYFVDGHDASVGIILQNLKELGFAERAHVFKRKLPFGVASIKLERKPDVIFCDPPYDKGFLAPTLELLAGQSFVTADTLFIAEHTKREMPDAPSLQTVKEKHFGQTLLSYLKLRD